MRLKSLLVVLVAMGLLVVAPAAVAKNSKHSPSEELRDSVKVSNIWDHLEALQRIADRNGGTRVSVGPGYTESVAYVSNKLRKAGYTVTIQPFQFEFVGDTASPEFEQVSPNAKTYTDFGAMQYSGSGDVTAAIIPIDVVVPMPPDAPPSSNTSGCEATDFAGFPAGAIALMQRGTCTFRVKAENAKAAGAAAMVIFNEGQVGRTTGVFGTLGAPPFDRAVISASYADGAELVGLYRNGSNPRVHVFTQTAAEERTSYNVIADSRNGDPNNIVMAGSHLDSVTAGPGINDNGTGSAATLEMALQAADEFDVNKKGKHKGTKNRLRFAWWGAEEQGLVGSEFYATTLTPEERAKIDLYMNFDMIGSPNYVRFVFDGDGSAALPGSTPAPPGSNVIERVFLEYFAYKRLASDPTAFDNRSDYGSFTPFLIPAGGLFTGAEGIKTAAQATTYGGTAGVAYDHCYHAACDTIANVNRKGLDQMSDAYAHALAAFAFNRALDSGTGGPPPNWGLSRHGH